MDNREIIISRAHKLLMDIGPTSMTMDMVARECGMSKRTLYEVFADKKTLILECLRADHDRNKEQVREIFRTAENCFDFYGTGVVTVTHYDPPEYGTTCLTLPVGSGVNGVDSTATFATLGVSTAYTYAFSMKNPKAQTSVNGRYYGHIMGAGATNTQKGSQKGAPLLIESIDTTGEKWIEVQTWTSGNKAQCLTILGYSSANMSWASEKAQEVEALEDGRWHDVVFTYDATAQHAMVFVDGVKVHDITSANLAEYLNYTDAGSAFATPSTSGTFCIGRNSAKSDNFAGSLSNVSVWNRALSAEEAVAISGSRLAGNESGLVLYWPLDGETGEPGVLVVNTAEDDGTAEHDTYDGEPEGEYTARTGGAQVPMPEPAAPKFDAFACIICCATIEERQFVRDLKANGVKDDFEVLQELAEKIAAGTMTEEDDRRLQRMVRASEQWYELERIRMCRYCPPRPGQK